MRTISAFGPNRQARHGQDLRLTARGDLEIVEGLESVRQRVIERLRFWRSEWFASGDAGVPYREEIFRDATGVGLASAVISDRIRDVADVTGVADVSVAIDGPTRRMSYRAGRVSSVFGSISLEDDIG